MQQNRAAALQHRQRPPRPIRDGEACSQHPARGAEAAARRRSVRLPQHAAQPAGEEHHPPADAGGLHAGGAARPHAVVPATAHRQPMRAQSRREERAATSIKAYMRSSPAERSAAQTS